MSAKCRSWQESIKYLRRSWTVVCQRVFIGVREFNGISCFQTCSFLVWIRLQLVHYEVFKQRCLIQTPNLLASEIDQVWLEAVSWLTGWHVCWYQYVVFCQNHISKIIKFLLWLLFPQHETWSKSLLTSYITSNSSKIKIHRKHVFLSPDGDIWPK